MPISFLGRIKEVNVKNCTDLSKSTKLTIMTEEAIAGALDEIGADMNVKITVTPA